MKKYYLLLFICFLTLEGFSQTNGRKWAKKLETIADTDVMSNLEVAPDSSIFSIGYINDAPNSSYPEGISIFKTDKDGNQLWQKGIDCWGEIRSHQTTIATTLDDTGNLYVVFQGSLSFEYGGKQIIPGGSGNKDFNILMKMGPNGEELWAKTFGNAINAEGLITLIEVNSNGDIIVGGEAKYAWDFAGQQVTFNTYGSAFMAAFEPDGSEKWLLDLGNIPTLHYLAKFKNNKLLIIYDEKQSPDYSEYYRRRIVNEDGSLGPILSTLKTWSPESPAQNETYENTFAYDSDSGIYYWSFYRISTSLVINDNDTLRAYLNNTNGFYLLKMDTNLNVLDSFKALNGKRKPAPIAVLPGKGLCIQTEVFGALYFDSTAIGIKNGADYAYIMMEFDQNFNLLDTFIVMSDRFDYFFNKGLAYMPNGDIVTQYASEEDITFGDTFFESANRSWTHMTVLGIHKGYFGEEDDDITNKSQVLKEEAITLFPNPAKDFISLRMQNNKEVLDYSIISMNGKQIANGQFKGSNYKIDISNLNVGMYLLQLRDTSGNMSHKKFMVSH